MYVYIIIEAQTKSRSMKKALKQTIIFALIETGNFHDALNFMAHELTLKEYCNVSRFFGYLESKNETIGDGNIDQQWNLFQLLSWEEKNKNPEPLKAKKESEDRRKKDLTTELVAGNRIDLHSFSFPLKSTKVISYDAQTKIVTLQVL